MSVISHGMCKPVPHHQVSILRFSTPALLEEESLVSDNYAEPTLPFVFDLLFGFQLLDPPL